MVSYQAFLGLMQFLGTKDDGGVLEHEGTSTSNLFFDRKINKM